jgi:DNA modification methylase
MMKTDPRKPLFMAKDIESWPLDRLIPYAKNARTHSDDQVDLLAGSIGEFGFVNPILVDSRDGIVAGHGRLLAARKLGLERVPVIVLDHLSDIQRRAYVLVDNGLASLAGCDNEMLALEVKALQEDSFKIELLGINDEIKRRVAQLEREVGNLDEDVAPDAPKEPVTVAGDLWILGDHRVLCGDATSMDSLDRVLSGEQADLIFTDPPYNVGYRQSAKGRRRGPQRLIANDDLGPEFEKFLHKACVNMLAVARGAIYVCMSSSELPTLHKVFIDAGGHWSTSVIWYKNTFTLGRSDYQRQYETLLYGWREGSAHYWCGARNQGDVWCVNKPRINDLHPTMKPVELIERALRNSSQRGNVVLDPFGGAGSTLIACEKTGRQARLIEIEPKYVDVTVLRWQQFTGRQATRATDGGVYTEIAA